MTELADQGQDADPGDVLDALYAVILARRDGDPEISHTARLYEDGKLVAEQTGRFNTKPGPGELHIGQCSDQPAPNCQVTGRIKNIEIYHRPLDAEEIARTVQVRPQ